LFCFFFFLYEAKNLFFFLFINHKSLQSNKHKFVINRTSTPWCKATPINQAQFCHQSHINSMVQSYTNQPSTILSSITHQFHGAKLHQSTKHNFVINHTSTPWCKATQINQAQFCHQSHINSMVQSYTNQPMHMLGLN
jgi:hypothetical protein